MVGFKKATAVEKRQAFCDYFPELGQTSEEDGRVACF